MLLLDTHGLIWVVEGSKRLGRRAARLADDALAGDGLGVASISFWEIAMLVNRGRISVDPSVDQWRLRVLGLGVQEVPLTGDIAIAAAGLPDLHGDPADRIIVATGVATSATLVTADDRILAWPGTLKRQDARR
jgi:PIN domain nuclease of toxin-antitoxin system